MSSLPLPIAAFIAGLVSFLSPCVLPLVPGYVSLISGVGVEELKTQERKLLSALMLNSLMFILGFSLVFIALGAVATTVGQFARDYYPILTRVAGIVIIIFGLHLTGIFKLNFLYTDKRLHNVKGGSSPWGAFAVGFAFAFGWTPCIGPILATILAFAGSQENVLQGVGLLAVYSLGLAVPFLLTSLGIDRFLEFYTRFRPHLNKVEIASGVLLIAVGALVFTRRFTLLAGWLNEMPVFQWLVKGFL
ncbi:MAG: cytochrome c biogenesis CcdA family protein [Terriglobales bacterium]